MGIVQIPGLSGYVQVPGLADLTPGTKTKVTIKDPETGESRDITATYVTAGPEVQSRSGFALGSWIVPYWMAGAGVVMLAGASYALLRRK